MAKREALRELQARLAKRLQTAQAQGMSVSWLAVRAGGGHYLLPLGQAGEIVALGAVQAVPYSQPWFRGVQNVRGNLVGVVDLAAFLAFDQGTPPAPRQAHTSGSEASVVTFNSALEVNCGLRVDALAGLRGADAFASDAPGPEGAPGYCGHRFTDPDGQTWQALDLRALARTPTFLHIAA